MNVFGGGELQLTNEKLDKKTYKNIKGYSRDEMNNFIYNIYVVAIEDTIKEIAKQKLFSREEFEEAFSKRLELVNGIGKGKKKIILELSSQIFEDMKEIQIETETKIVKL